MQILVEKELEKHNEREQDELEDEQEKQEKNEEQVKGKTTINQVTLKHLYKKFTILNDKVLELKETIKIQQNEISKLKTELF